MHRNKSLVLPGQLGTVAQPTFTHCFICQLPMSWDSVQPSVAQAVHKDGVIVGVKHNGCSAPFLEKPSLWSRITRVFRVAR